MANRGIWEENVRIPIGAGREGKSLNQYVCVDEASGKACFGHTHVTYEILGGTRGILILWGTRLRR